MTSTSTHNTLSTPSTYTRILCSIGILLSCYALYVEHKTHGKSFDKDSNVSSSSDNNIFEEDFKALCDIEAIGASCRWVGSSQVEFSQKVQNETKSRLNPSHLSYTTSSSSKRRLIITSHTFSKHNITPLSNLIHPFSQNLPYCYQIVLYSIYLKDGFYHTSQ